MNRIDVIGQNGNDGEHYDKIDKILDDREKTHGKYADVAALDFEMSALFNDALSQMIPTDALAIKMILHKIARISCGDPSFADHWDDIAWYAARAIEYRKSTSVATSKIVCTVDVRTIDSLILSGGMDDDWWLAFQRDIVLSVMLIINNYEYSDHVRGFFEGIADTAKEYSAKYCKAVVLK